MNKLRYTHYMPFDGHDLQLLGITDSEINDMILNITKEKSLSKIISVLQYTDVKLDEELSIPRPSQHYSDIVTDLGDLGQYRLLELKIDNVTNQELGYVPESVDYDKHHNTFIITFRRYKIKKIIKTEHYVNNDIALKEGFSANEAILDGYDQVDA